MCNHVTRILNTWRVFLHSHKHEFLFTLGHTGRLMWGAGARECCRWESSDRGHVSGTEGHTKGPTPVHMRRASQLPAVGFSSAVMNKLPGVWLSRSFPPAPNSSSELDNLPIQIGRQSPWFYQPVLRIV